MQSSAKLLRVEPSMVPAMWPYAGPMIRRAVEKTGLSDYNTVESEVLQGKQSLWVVSDDGLKAAGTTKIVIANDRKICLLVTCSGRGLSKWIGTVLQGIEAYAKAENCSTMRIYGRKGLERVLSGFASKYAVIDKEIA